MPLRFLCMLSWLSLKRQHIALLHFTLVIDNANGIYSKNTTTKKAIVLMCFMNGVFECPACHTRKQKPGGTGYRGEARTGEFVRGDELRKCSLIN